MSNLDPCAPHVYIDDNKNICIEAHRTNALVVEVNPRLGVLGFLDDLTILRDQIQFYNRDRAPPHAGTLSAKHLKQQGCCLNRAVKRAPAVGCR